MKGEKNTKINDFSENSINVELKTQTENTTRDDVDDILITSETYDRLRERNVNIKNKKYRIIFYKG